MARRRYSRRRSSRKDTEQWGTIALAVVIGLSVAAKLSAQSEVLLGTLIVLIATVVGGAGFYIYWAITAHERAKL